jgi:hypothetical protein
MKLLKIIFSFILSILSFPFVFALQQSGGPLIAYTPLGGSNETKWGIGNNDNATIILKMRAEGDAADYVTFPATVDIEPGKFVYIPIEISLPKNETLLRKNITGNMFALLEGKTGSQVVINLQAKKSITIIPYESGTQQQANPETKSNASPQTSLQTNSNFMTGFLSLANIGTNIAIIISAIAVVLIGVFIYLNKFKGVKM